MVSVVALPSVVVVVVPRWASGLPLLWPSRRCIPWLEWLATMAFWSPMSHFVAFGTMGIMCQAACSASWVLLCAVGAVLRGYRWFVTIAVVAGVGHSPFVLADSVHCFGAVGDLFLGVLDGEVVHSNVSQLIGGCLEGLGHKFPKELSLMVVCTDNTAMQFVLAMLIIDHLTAVHQCLDVCDEILGVLSQPGHDIFEFSKMDMGVDVCHSLLDSVKEGRSFHLGCFLFLLAASWHPLCMHFQGFGSQSCKDISEVVLTVWWDVVEEDPVLQGTAKYQEGVIGILGIPVVDWQADGCHPTC